MGSEPNPAERLAVSVAAVVTAPAVAVVGALPAEIRPRLRGWLHAATIPIALLGAIVLWRSAAPGGYARSALVFGIAMIGLYAGSSLYHVVPWGSRMRFVMGRIDQMMIQIMIAGTFTPIAFHTLSGQWRVWSLVVAWLVALVGSGIAWSPIQAPRWVAFAGFIGFGWLAVIPFARIITALPWEGTGLIVLGGLLYTIGAVVWVRQRPNPIPEWFGFHEVFHLLVIAATTAHYLAIWRYVLPIA